jgi:hypothetical protein
MNKQRWAVMCSMTGYWGVVRPEHVHREDDGLLACSEWESLHDTWTEAIQEADRMARTVTATLTLPAYRNPTAINVDRASPVTIYTAGPITQIEAGGMRTNLFRHELEQLALTLLAHARRQA